ncbi:glycoside hydrolase family 16 protein [Kitasatospora sp. NPDC057542]|uniref:glycoside hydrolase family 16 protein n=1 Tax=Streptomycetaceae TaxID=2062 RepID=UPI001CCE2B0F|nr:glycoside hydrolase family 16 protein [Streptomyces sp. LS1784]
MTRLTRHTRTRAALGIALPLTMLAACASACASGKESPGPTAGRGQEAQQAATAAPTPTTPPGPPGVLFDAFHYTGAEDPSLAAHGWTVRTDGGGPGIRDTWSKEGVSFPTVADAQSGQAMQLRVTSDGTPKGTKQVEVGRSTGESLNGTIAARIFFSDKPADGRDGDHIIQTAYAISPDHNSQKYSELDFEYMPNGGWGAPGPRLDTTSWRSSAQNDRDTLATKKSVAGWHTLMMTADNGKVTYSVDGKALFSSGNKSYPREPLSIRFSSWLIDLPATMSGTRTWDMKVNWLYYQADKNVTLAEAEKAVSGFYATNTNFVNTLPKH